MIRKLSLAAASACLMVLTAGAVGDSCSTLSVTSETDGDTTTWSIDLGGAHADSLAWALIGEAAGDTTYDLGLLGSVSFGLAEPFIMVPLGATDADGNASLAFEVPAGDPLGVDVFLQGATFTVGLDFSVTPPVFGFDSCTSNVVGASF